MQHSNDDKDEQSTWLGVNCAHEAVLCDTHSKDRVTRAPAQRAHKHQEDPGIAASLLLRWHYTFQSELILIVLVDVSIDTLFLISDFPKS